MSLALSPASAMACSAIGRCNSVHEMSLCEGVIQIIEEQAKVQNYQRVKTVWLEIGALAGVELAALSFGFEVVCRGTLAEGARLEIIHTAGQAWCMDCAKTVEISARYDACPACGDYHLQVSGGDELKIKELEVE